MSSENVEKPSRVWTNGVRRITGLRSQPKLKMGGDRAQRTFQRKLSTSMPEVQKAKKLVLTIDHERSKTSKSNPDSLLTKELVGLTSTAFELDEEMKNLSVSVRQHADKSEFEQAIEALDKGLTVARKIIALEEKLVQILTEYEQEVPDHLAGEYEPPKIEVSKDEPAEGELEFQKQWKESLPKILQALEIDSTCPAIKRDCEQLRTWYEECLEDQKQKEFGDASKTLQLIDKRVYMVTQGQESWEKFQEESAKHTDLFGHLQVVKPVQKEKLAQQKRALLARQAAQTAAADGLFVEAHNHLKEAVTAAKLALPDGGEAAISFRADWKLAQPQIESALQINSGCKAIEEDQETLREYKKEIEEAASENEFSDGQYTIGLALKRAQWIAIQYERWKTFQMRVDAHSALLKAAEKINV